MILDPYLIRVMEALLGQAQAKESLMRTKKADFNTEEWARVVEGPLLAGMRVATVERGRSQRDSEEPPA